MTEFKLMDVMRCGYEALKELIERREKAAYGNPALMDGSDGRYARARAALKRMKEALGE